MTMGPEPITSTFLIALAPMVTSPESREAPVDGGPRESGLSETPDGSPGSNQAHHLPSHSARTSPGYSLQHRLTPTTYWLGILSPLPVNALPPGLFAHFH